jgi:3-phosphoshikimate 1-carboxyvinyltransferase
MTAIVVHPADKPLTGSVTVASDKSIAHRALLLGALGRGKTRISGLSRVADNITAADCLRAMGVTIDAPTPAEVVIVGVGLDGLRAPEGVLDCGASETAMHLLCGVLAAQRFRATLVLRDGAARPTLMGTVRALRARGAVVDGRRDARREGDITAPLVVGPLPDGRRLAGLEYESPDASAQVKGAILLSGLYAEGITIFREPTVSRDHTERLLAALGVPIRTAASVVQIDTAHWDGDLRGFEVVIPGDLSAAAFLVGAAQMVPGSRVIIRGVGINPTRTGLLEIARDMGAGLAIEPQGERSGEPVAEVHTWSAPLRAIVAGGETVLRAVDEIPIACALAARASGTTRIAGAEALAPTARNRIASMARVLRAFGVACEPRPDGIDIDGGERSCGPADVDSGGDPRIAMAAAVLALAGRAPSRVRDAACIAASYPKFVGTLRALGARIDVEP